MGGTEGYCGVDGKVPGCGELTSINRVMGDGGVIILYPKLSKVLSLSGGVAIGYG
jgi:hypothetical protein